MLLPLLSSRSARVHLIESNGKKAAFLREVVKAAVLPAVVHQERVEKFGESCAEAVQVVTARALAPLKTGCALRHFLSLLQAPSVCS